MSSQTAITGSGPPAARIVGRAPLPASGSNPTSTPGLYVVTTNTGTITVVTRTVAAGQAGTGPRVVTVNTINNPRTSVAGLRTPTPATVVSLGPKTVQTVRVSPQAQGSGLRPVMGNTKSNVIVVHKGGGPPGVRPMGFQAVRVTLYLYIYYLYIICL